MTETLATAMSQAMLDTNMPKTTATTTTTTTKPKTMSAPIAPKSMPTTTVTSVTEISDEDSTKSTLDEKTGKSLAQLIFARHTTRRFHKHIPVDMKIIEECLSIAQHSPSSTNVQPWRLTFTRGAKLEKLRELMTAAVVSGVPSTVPPLPEKFKHYRSEFGHQIYSSKGWDIPRSDKQGVKNAQLGNYKFWDAPLIAVVGMDESLMGSGADVLSAGLYLQTLVLLLTERGLATSMQVSTSGYAQVLRQELGVPECVNVLCTLGIGYEDEDHRINKFEMPRNAWRDHVEFVE